VRYVAGGPKHESTGHKNGINSLLVVFDIQNEGVIDLDMSMTAAKDAALAEVIYLMAKEGRHMLGH
jgi:hypothetical protein